MFWITNGGLKIFERLFTNSMFVNGDYIDLVGTTFAAALIEILSHITYFHRAFFVEKAVKSIMKLKQNTKRLVRSVFVVSRIDSAKDEESGTVWNEIEWLANVRKELIIEDISIELMMIFTVTFLLYLAHPLIDNEKISLISSFDICLVQLLIQIAFELTSDIFGLYWTIARHKIDLNTIHVSIKNRWYWVWIFFISYQSLLILWFILSY
eukprot:TRINITY_DN9768_c0_g2_i1.p1 TRINITY_DN9768_c0_g2~~TRINITY_DN9768_c0_g2_i1.p1  ORF type:complete len:210 (-),score=26.44 TRINITY_DN9768_c0_g2_i1:49-678(-)